MSYGIDDLRVGGRVVVPKKVEVVYEPPEPQPPPKVREYVLRLTPEEAGLVLALVGSVSLENGSGPNVAWPIYDALFKAGVGRAGYYIQKPENHVIQVNREC